MPEEYVMKDLGYPRTPTKAWMVVDMPDGSRWRVPVQAIVDSRDFHYLHQREDTVGHIRSGELDSDNIADWACGDMNWYDVEDYAVQVPTDPATTDFQEGWVNGKKSFEGDI